MADLPATVPEGAWYVDSGGAPRQIPAEQAPDAEAMGWTPATPEQIQETQLQAKYGDATGQLKATAAAAARALTFGGSDLALTKTGLVEPETLQRLKEANPAADTIGTVAGIAAPLLLTGGAAAPAEAGAMAAARGAAEVSAPALVSRLGQAATRAVGEALPEASGLVGKLVSKAVASGAGSAIEGAAYGLGQVVSEDALGDPNLTAQSALATVGISAALGGGLGGALGIVGEAVPAAIGKARDALGGAVAKMKEAYPTIAERLTGVDADTIREGMAKYDAAFKDPRAIVKLQTDLGGALEDVANQVADARRALYSEARPAEAADLIKGQSAWDLKPLSAQQAAVDAYDRGIATIRAQPDLHTQAYATKLEGMRDGFLKRTANGDPVNIFEELRTARQQVDDLIPWDKGPVKPSLPDAEAGKVLRGVRTEIKAALVDPEAWGPAAARQAALDEMHAEYETAFKTLTSGKLGPLRSNILPPVKAGGDVSYQLNPRALRTALNQMGDPRGDRVAEAMTNYLQTASKYIDGMEESFSHAPAASFDREGLQGLVGKTSDLVEQAQQQASATRFLHDLDPNAGIGSGGARALLPQASTEGAASGLGTLAAAPLLGHMVPGLGPVAAVYGAGKAAFHAYEGLKNIPQTVAMLSKLERMTQRIGSAIDSASSTLVRGGVKAENVGRAEIAAGIAREFSSSAEDSAKRFSRRVAEIQRLSQDPETLHRTIVTQNQGLDEHAPNTSQALAITSARAVSFLASKMPQAPVRGPLAPKWQASPSEVAKFARYYEAVNDPLVILKQAAAGTLSPEAVEAVQTVYPDLMNRIRTGLVEKMTSHGGQVPRRSRIMLGAILGQDVDGSMGEIAANQLVYQKHAAQKNAAPAIKPTSKGVSSISLSNRTLTSAQATAQRRG